jgi:hypothetical protein
MSRTWNIAGKHSYYSKRVIIIYALLLSVLWHFAWGALFNVDLERKDMARIRTTRAAFLGDFLDKSLLKEDLSSYKDKEKRTDSSIFFMEEADIDLAILPERIFFKERKEAKVYSSGGFKEGYEEEALLSSVSRTVELKYERIIISGPLKGRGLLYLPQEPDVPQWLKDEGRFTVKYKVYADRHGRVVFLEQLSSSGNTEIDLLAGRYLRKIRFSRAPEFDVDEQWGIIEVKLGPADDRS